MATHPPDSSGYMPQLDGLRTLAVAAVIVHHYIPSDSVIHRIDFGAIGITLFFVLSGFLITGILLRSRRAIEAGRQTRAVAVKQFYIRRTLRIFPLYYLVLLLAVVFGVAFVRENFGWYAFYLTNVLAAIRDDNGFALVHFWTLAVEEQFYLAWPWLILFLPRRMLGPTLVACIAIAPIFRCIAHLAGANQVAINALTLGSLDSLGAGALLAYMRDSWAPDGNRVQRITRISLAAGLIIWALSHFVPQLSGSLIWRAAISPFMYPLVFSWLIDRASRGFGGHLGAFLSCAPMTALGRISYGIYVYHGALMVLVPPMAAATGYPILHILDKGFGWMGITPSTSPGTLFGFLFWVTLTIIVAAVSWFCFEKPINRLKDRFR